LDRIPVKKVLWPSQLHSPASGAIVKVAGHEAGYHHHGFAMAVLFDMRPWMMDPMDPEQRGFKRES